MPVLLTTDHNGVRRLILNRPEVRNALNNELRQALLSELSESENDSSVRALVLSGSGKAFCSGLDLSDLQSISQRSTEENRHDSAQLAELFKRIYTFPKPIIAALNGHAIAGGAGLASVCDVVVMSETAKLGYTEARIGFVAALVAVFLLRQVGEKHTRDLLLSARLISANEARHMGLVNHITAPEKVLDHALELAMQITANAPSSLAMTKSLLADLPGMGLSEGLRYASEINALARTTTELKEGVAAFLEKRPPDWQA